VDGGTGLWLDFGAAQATIERGNAMNIEIRDSTLRARIQKQLEATGSGSVEELLARLTGDAGGAGPMASGKSR